jgi:MoxR-like ATPase
VHVAEPVLEYALGLVQATRGDQRIRLGASSRAAITLVRCAQALALLRDREYVVPDDVRALAVPVLAHRLVMAASYAGGAGALSQAAEGIVSECVGRVRVPVGR